MNLHPNSTAIIKPHNHDLYLQRGKNLSGQFLIFPLNYNWYNRKHGRIHLFINPNYYYNLIKIINQPTILRALKCPVSHFLLLQLKAIKIHEFEISLLSHLYRFPCGLYQIRLTYLHVKYHFCFYNLLIAIVAL